MAEKPEKKVETSTKSKYPLEELTANAEALFSVHREVMVGALHGVTVNEMSVAEAKNLVKQFLEKKVK
ncbi:hypothetical protein [Paenibacillus dokdonensis]|uniref:hypothetical protein n=1 Tax=Paenibacillus dokdonensis TaxID=2567944 RepID=UPI0010A7B5A3|nr:hypothetical protein [Paenibacillus dokdonensis]